MSRDAWGDTDEGITGACPTCHGTGTCDECDGSGKGFTWDTPCIDCDQTGVCRTCDGTGEVES